MAKEDNMYDSDLHVYMSLTDINKKNHAEDPYLPGDLFEDPSLPSETLPNQISSTVSPNYIVETLRSPFPPELLPTPVVEVPYLTYWGIILQQI